jgi:hypothetical protein
MQNGEREASQRFPERKLLRATRAHNRKLLPPRWVILLLRLVTSPPPQSLAQYYRKDMRGAAVGRHNPMRSIPWFILLQQVCRDYTGLANDG